MKQLSRSHFMVPLRKQRGAALLVSLVILFAISIITVGSLSTSSLEARMAVNTQIQMSVFQMAESGVAEVIGDFDQFVDANKNPGIEVNSQYEVGDTSLVEAVTSLEFRGVPGEDAYSRTNTNTNWTVEGSSASKFIILNFESRSRGQLKSDNNVNTTVVQGVYRKVPAL